MGTHHASRGVERAHVEKARGPAAGRAKHSAGVNNRQLVSRGAHLDSKRTMNHVVHLAQTSSDLIQLRKMSDLCLYTGVTLTRSPWTRTFHAIKFEFCSYMAAVPVGMTVT